MLVLTMSIMGVASFAIGLLPTYATIGMLAPILLILLRLIQGFAVGGEWGGAALMALEHSDESKRGFSASFANMGAPAGAVLSTVVLAIVTLLPDDAFLSWGWRIPFLLSRGPGRPRPLRPAQGHRIPPVRAGSHHRRALEKKRLPIIDVLRNNPKSVLLGIGAGLGAFALQALMATFALTIGVQAGLPRSTVLWLFAAGSFVQMFALPAYAALSDRIGRRPVMITGCIAAIIAVYPILLLIASGSILGALLGFLIAMPLVQAAMYGPLAAFTTEIFATGNRYTGASLGYQLSSTLGGGFAPLIAASLVAGTTTGNGLLRVALFSAAAALISAITIAIAKESSKRNLITAGLTSNPDRRAEATLLVRGLGTTTPCCRAPRRLIRTSGKNRRGSPTGENLPGQQRQRCGNPRRADVTRPSGQCCAWGAPAAHRIAVRASRRRGCARLAGHHVTGTTRSPTGRPGLGAVASSGLGFSTRPVSRSRPSSRSSLTIGTP